MKPLPQLTCRQTVKRWGNCAVLLATMLVTCTQCPAIGFGQDFGRNRVAHGLTHSNEPPGVLGFKRRIQGDIGEDYFQPVRLIGPTGVVFSPAEVSEGGQPNESAVFGLQVGVPYRFRISHIPLVIETELYPSIELLDRLHAPAGMETRFAVPIEFSKDDLRNAAEGNYVVRVVYVEDPDLALPIAESSTTAQRVEDVRENEDPLSLAHARGRPIAIVRLGSKSPGLEGATESFLFGSPPVRHLGRADLPVPLDHSQLSTPRPFALGRAGSTIR